MNTIARLNAIFILCFCQQLHADNRADAAAQLKKFPAYQTGYLSKEASLKSFKVPEGFKLELVLSDPIIKEPVAIAWDGNGVMYVAEMRTYMQDANGKDEQKPLSRISRHEDTNGDGIYDKHSVFIDNLLLPRMILPLDDRIMVGITNSLDLWTYRDTNGDGVADEKIKIYKGGKRGGNMEHQPSGLVWGLDNWIYLTYQSIRYRFTDGKLVTQKIPHGAGQWGLTQDDDGRFYYSLAGGEKPALAFQQPPIYGLLNLRGQLAPAFQKIFPTAPFPDVQGGPARVGSNGSINHFTGVAGQEIFRGDSLPETLYGDLFIPEPVGRFIRRAKVSRVNGMTKLSNATPGKEFISTRDVNFRPVQNVTGPDGCLYIVDMHRGIIQQANWTGKGSYLREIIDRTGLAENVSHGRIYRLVHKDYQPGASAAMLKQSTIELTTHLSHKNGWRRDTAKKLIILRKDRDSALPALEKLVLDPQQKIQTRIAALWTIEGCSAVTQSLITKLLGESNPRILTHAIRVSEPFILHHNSAILNAINKLASTRDPEVALQLLNSIHYCGYPKTLQATQKTLLASHQKVTAVRVNHQRRKGQIAAQKKHAAALAKNSILALSMARGKATYQSLCIACHGADGKGQPLAGQAGHFLGAPLANSPRVLGSGTAITLTLLHGMEGQINGKSYDGMMPMQGSNSDLWISDIASYVRNSFGNHAPIITEKQVAEIRKKHSKRSTPWTQKELEQLDPPKKNLLKP